MRAIGWGRGSVILLTACVLTDVTIENRGCPCVEGWACRDGVCVVDGAVSDAGAVDGGACDKMLEFDPENCGACGRSCQGAACKGGVCIPKLIAGDRSFPTALSLSPRWLTFTTFDGAYPGGAVSYCPLAGCGPSTSAHQILVAAPISLASTADDIFWADGNGAIRRYFHEQSPDGSFGNQTVESDLASVSDIALGGTRLYFAESAASGSIRACDEWDLTTCGDGGSALVASNQVNLRALVFDPSSHRLFWISDDRAGSIASCDASGPCPEPAVVIENQPTALALAVDATHVYWTNATANGAVMRAPKAGLGAGEAPTTLASGLAMPWAIALDGEYVYVTVLGAGAAADAAAADGTLVRIPRAGGDALVLARGLDRPWAIALDQTSIYWTNRSTVARKGSIESVAR